MNTYIIPKVNQRESIPEKERCKKCDGVGVRSPRRNSYTCKYCKGTGRRPARKPRVKLINPFRKD